MKAIKKKGRLILQEIQFDEIYHKRTMKNTDNSCKVTLPIELLKKKVYVIVDPKE